MPSVIKKAYIVASTFGESSTNTYYPYKEALPERPLGKPIHRDTIYSYKKEKLHIRADRRFYFNAKCFTYGSIIGWGRFFPKQVYPSPNEDIEDLKCKEIFEQEYQRAREVNLKKSKKTLQRLEEILAKDYEEVSEQAA